MKVLSVFRYGFFFHAISDIRLQYLGPLSVLYSNGLARYPSPWHCPWPRYLPSRICLRPRLVLVLQTPLLRGSNYGITCWLGKCGTGGVAVMGLENLICPRATARQTLAHYLIGSRIVLDLHYRCVTGVSLRRSGREVEVRHLFSSTLVVFSWKKTCSVFFKKNMFFFWKKNTWKKTRVKMFFFQNHLFSR